MIHFSYAFKLSKTFYTINTKLFDENMKYFEYATVVDA